jgi:PAS domain S-box-containing protein
MSSSPPASDHVVADDAPGFLAGGGTMGALIRAYDWASSPLGPPASWPQGLKTAVRLLLSTGHPMFIWWGPELIQFYNDAYSRSIGPERHPGALGQPGRECWEEIWDIIGPQIAQVMAGQGHTWHENQLVPITRHGRREDVYWTYSYGPIDDPAASSGVGGVLVVCTETTEQVHAEQRMREAEARWRALFEQVPGFMCILSGPEHRFEFANSRYADLVGGRELIGKTLREALPEVETQGFVALLDEVYRTGVPHAGAATPVTLRRGPDHREHVVHVDFVYQPIRDAANTITGILVAGYDVTERETAHVALRAQDRRKDEFLAMLAHELRNPLAPIRNASELLTRHAGRDATTRSIGDLVSRQVAQLTRLVDDLLDISRITRDRIELQREPVELQQAIALAIESVQPFIAEKRHAVTRDIPTAPLHAEGDLARIVQCIANLLNNAAKFTPPGGHITVGLREERGRGVIEVTDDGAGIAPELLPDVFELFVQAERTLDRTQGGLGIGLSVVQRLVHMHGGEVTATSPGLGRGSTFEIALPLTAAPKRAEMPSQTLEPRSRHVLVVDDNVDAADSLAELLRLEGHVAECAYGAGDALERAATFPAEVVLLDIGLPEMDGYEVARRLRAEGAKATLVALTGYGQAEDVQRALDAGFDAHVTKPVELAALRRILAGDLDAAG